MTASRNLLVQGSIARKWVKFNKELLTKGKTLNEIRSSRNMSGPGRTKSG